MSLLAGLAIGSGVVSAVSGAYSANKAASAAKRQQDKALAMLNPPEVQDLRKGAAQAATNQVLPGLYGGESISDFVLSPEEKQAFIESSPEAQELLANETTTAESNAQIQDIDNQLASLERRLGPTLDSQTSAQVRTQIARLESQKEELQEFNPDREIAKLFAETRPDLNYNAETGKLQQTEEVEGTLNQLQDLSQVEVDPRLGELTEGLVGPDGQIQEQGDAVAQAILDQGLAMGVFTQDEVNQIKSEQASTGRTLDEAAESVLGPEGSAARVQQLESQVPGSISQALNTAQTIAQQGAAVTNESLSQAQSNLSRISQQPGVAVTGGAGQQVLESMVLSGPVGTESADVNRFQADIGNAIRSAQTLEQEIRRNADDLIAANEQASQFEEQQALEQLTDALSARGLAGGGAEIEARNNLTSSFARDRQLSSAKIRQEAEVQANAQRLQSLQTIGQLAGSGAGTGIAGSQLQLQAQQLQQAAAQQAGQLRLNQAQVEQENQRLQLAAAQAQAQTGLAQAGLSQAGIGQQLEAARLSGQLGLQGLTTQAQLAGQEAGLINQATGQQLQGAQLQAALAGQTGAVGRAGAETEAQLAIQGAGIPAATTAAELAALTQQQQLEQGAQQATFGNVGSIASLQQGLLNTSTNQATSSGIAAGNVQAQGASDLLASAGQAAAGAGAALGSTIQLAGAVSNQNQAPGGTVPGQPAPVYQPGDLTPSDFYPGAS